MKHLHQEREGTAPKGLTSSVYKLLFAHIGLHRRNRAPNIAWLASPTTCNPSDPYYLVQK